mmetsp:Transcript_13957/g.20110  ORF Transcript_13957/g.20110 Transcript_13957/m.20110 type:complete len:231 (+) Transcript_13957:1760-2452(+)
MALLIGPWKPVMTTQRAAFAVTFRIDHDGGINNEDSTDVDDDMSSAVVVITGGSIQVLVDNTVLSQIGVTGTISQISSLLIVERSVWTFNTWGSKPPHTITNNLRFVCCSCCCLCCSGCFWDAMSARSAERILPVPLFFLSLSLRTIPLLETIERSNFCEQKSMAPGGGAVRKSAKSLCFKIVDLGLIIVDMGLLRPAATVLLLCIIVSRSPVPTRPFLLSFCCWSLSLN